MPDDPDALFDSIDDDFPDDDDSLWFDCALGPDGQCGKAGTEECDLECGALDLS